MPADILRDLGKDAPSAETAPAPEPDVPIKSLLDLIERRDAAFRETFGTPAELKAQKETAEKKATQAEATSEAVFQGVALPGVARAIKATQAPLPKVPEPIPEPPVPSLKGREYLDVPEKNALGALVTGLGVMAQLAMAGKAPVAALSALTGAMEGWHTGDAERAQREWRRYVTQVDQIRTENRQNMARFEASMQVHGANITAAQADLVASMALAGHYQQAAAIARQGVIPAYNQMVDAVAHGDKLMDQTIKVVEAQEARKLREAIAADSHNLRLAQIALGQENLKLHERSVGIQEQRLGLQKQAAAAQLSDDALNAAADRVAQGEDPSQFVRGRGGAATTQFVEIQNRAVARTLARGDLPGAITLNRRNLIANTDALKKITKEEAEYQTFLVTFEKTLDRTKLLAEKIERSGVPVWDRKLLVLKANVEGNEDAKNLLAQMEILSRDADRILSRAKGVGAEQSRQEARRLMDPGMTNGQFHSLIDNVLTPDALYGAGGFVEVKAALQRAISGGAAAHAVGSLVNPEAASGAARKARIKGPDGSVSEMVLLPNEVLPKGYTEVTK